MLAEKVFPKMVFVAEKVLPKMVFVAENALPNLGAGLPKVPILGLFAVFGHFNMILALKCVPGPDPRGQQKVPSRWRRGV